MKKWMILLPVLCLVLGGCSWLDGSYVSVTPHQEQTVGNRLEVVSASNYQELVEVLETFVAAGQESGVINVVNYSQGPVEDQMEAAVRHIREIYPIGAYAVSDIRYELGTNGSKPALAVNIEYGRSNLEIRRIRNARNMEEAALLVGKALDNYDSVLTMQVDDYHKMDLEQLVQDYVRENPNTVMEMPQVAFADYGTGFRRVVEMTFTYQNSRESLRQMQTQVQPVFASAALYVSGEGADSQKFSQLYSFLMERFDYTLETSITPAYSLLRHGVGDSKAFAVVYAAMCRAAGLECMTVTGSRNGEPWTWNMIRENDGYYHVDLLRGNQLGGFRKFVDADMSGYVWDYSAYPECVKPYAAPADAGETFHEEETQPTQEPGEDPSETTEETVPE